LSQRYETGRQAQKQHKRNQMQKEGYPVVVDARDSMKDPVKGLPKGRA
jgi:hypothetical protein